MVNTQINPTNTTGELRNRTDEVHPVDPFHSLDILKNHFASVTFCRNSGVDNIQNGCDRVILRRLCKRVSSSLMDGGRMLSNLLFFMLPIAVLTNEV